jgi:hypothetical protein
MTKAQDRAGAMAQREVNALRLRYRLGLGDEAELVREITELSARCDYPAEANQLLFFGDDRSILWGFGCWKIEAETGQTTRQRTKEIVR